MTAISCERHGRAFQLQRQKQALQVMVRFPQRKPTFMFLASTFKVQLFKENDFLDQKRF